MLMQAEPGTPLWWLILSGLFYLTGVVAFLAVIAAVLWLKARVGRLTDRVQRVVEPTATKIEQMVDHVHRTVTTAASRLDEVTARANEAAERVADRVDRVTDRYEEYLLQPAHRVAAVVAGVQEAWQKLRDRQARGTASESPPSQSKTE